MKTCFLSIALNTLCCFLLLLFVVDCYVGYSPAFARADVSEECELRAGGCKQRAGKECPEDETCQLIDGVCDCFK